tara:strand:+ start:1251 stop:1511 length:261 start_codon:yes stop_codon:yes gene_type:complete
MNHNYKKIIIYFFLTVFSILIIIKYSISFLKNEILNVIKSDRFDVFIINILDQKIEKLANTEIPDKKKKFYKEKIDKILLKIKELD